MIFHNYLKSRLELPDPQLAEIISFFTQKVVAKGNLLVRAGQICSELFYIEKGIFRIFHSTKEGKEATACFFLEGQFAFEIISFVKRSNSLESLEALEESVVYGIHQDVIQQLYKKYPVMERFFRMVMEDQFAFFKEVMLGQLRETTEERYLKIVNDKPSLLQRVPLKHLASYLGINEPSLSRIRKRLTQK